MEDEDPQLQLHTEFAISSGKVEAFKKIAQEMIEVIRAKEPRTLRYQWYFNKDENKAYLVEEYPDAAALLVHAKDVVQFLPKLLEASKITKCDVLGKLNLEVELVLAVLRPQSFRYWNGLAR